VKRKFREFAGTLPRDMVGPTHQLAVQSSS
jgi:hypothetical protein